MEFHAVILCGPGKQLSPFSKVRATGVPKALLPLAQKPMLEYVLDWCEKAFFPKITIVCDDASGKQIREALESYKAAKQAQGSASGADGSSETARFVNSITVADFDGASSGAVLRHLTTSDLLGLFRHFVLLPCDFITDLPPQVLIEAYRCRQATDLGTLCYYNNDLDLEDKKNKIFPKNYTVYADLPGGTAQMLDFYSAEDVDFHKGFTVRTQLLWKHPKATVSTKLLNSSVFFGDKTLVFDAFEKNASKFTELYCAARPLIKIIRDLARKEWQATSWPHTVAFVVIPKQARFIRANRVPVYMEANRHYLKIQARENSGAKAGPKDKAAATVGADSMVDESTQLGEKTNVKRSVVGKNCIIGKRVKLTGSVVHDGAVIEDDVQLENTIVGHDCHIHCKSKLTNCYVEATNSVAKATQSKGETLLCLTLEGLVESAVESSSSDGEDTDSSYDDYDDEFGDNSDGLFGY